MVEDVDPGPLAHATAGRAGPEAYARRLADVLVSQNWAPVAELTRLFAAARESGRAIYVCGNGGSAANATHWGNDFIYPVARNGRGLRITALTANTAVLTCLANDVGYEHVFSHQLRVLAQPGDVLLVLSGSGKSPNVVEALRAARTIGMKTAGIFGFDGGPALGLVDLAVHVRVDDMQIAEDMQLVVNHMVMRALAEHGT